MTKLKSISIKVLAASFILISLAVMSITATRSIKLRNKNFLMYPMVQYGPSLVPIAQSLITNVEFKGDLICFTSVSDDNYQCAKFQNFVLVETMMK